MKKLLFILFLVPLLSFSQEETAYSKVISLLNRLESCEWGNNDGIYKQEANQIATLTGIYPQKYEGNFLGIFFNPNLEELKVWRDYIILNKDKISFGRKTEDNIEILLEYEPGKFRHAYFE